MWANARGDYQVKALELLRAELLCRGTRCSPSVKAWLRRTKGLSPGFIHGVVLMLPNGQAVNTRVLDQSATRVDAPQLVADGDLVYVDDGRLRVLVDPLPAGAALLGNMRGLPTAVASFSLHNPATLFCSPVDQCIYGTIGKPCTFCTYDMTSRVRQLDPASFSHALQRIRDSRPRVANLALGGGTPTLSDSGASYYADLASRAKALGLATSVELVPPEQLERMDPLFESADALIMSLEVWDDARREEICLGKGYLGRTHYARAWQRCLNALGPGTVASVLIVGLEPLESTLRGALALIQEGVIPTLIPFRRYDRMAGAPASYDVEPEDYLQLSALVRHELARNSLDAGRQPGCTGCGGCSMEVCPASDQIGGVITVASDRGLGSGTPTQNAGEAAIPS